MIYLVRKLPLDLRTKIYDIYLLELNRINMINLCKSINRSVITCFECERYIMTICEKCRFNNRFMRPLWNDWFACDECEDNGMVDVSNLIEDYVDSSDD